MYVSFVVDVVRVHAHQPERGEKELVDESNQTSSRSSNARYRLQKLE